MNVLRPLVSATLAAALLAGTTGCGVLYSKQTYGSPATQRISVGASRADVFANMGAPNSIYSNETGEVFVYKLAKGVNVLGLYSSINRTDTVVVMDPNGVVIYAGDVPVGKGWTLISGPVLDATHPVRTDTLLFEPENYGTTVEE
jgi:hypothetical protein